MDNIALFFHLLGAVLFVAGIVLAGTAFEAARRREQPAEIAHDAERLRRGDRSGR
jgi:hypothetical protein